MTLFLRIIPVFDWARRPPCAVFTLERTRTSRWIPSWCTMESEKRTGKELLLQQTNLTRTTRHTRRVKASHVQFSAIRRSSLPRPCLAPLPPLPPRSALLSSAVHRWTSMWAKVSLYVHIYLFISQKENRAHACFGCFVLFGSDFEEKSVVLTTRRTAVGTVAPNSKGGGGVGRGKRIRRSNAGVPPELWVLLWVGPVYGFTGKRDTQHTYPWTHPLLLTFFPPSFLFFSFFRASARDTDLKERKKEGRNLLLSVCRVALLVVVVLMVVEEEALFYRLNNSEHTCDLRLRYGLVW